MKIIIDQNTFGDYSIDALETIMTNVIDPINKGLKLIDDLNLEGLVKHQHILNSILSVIEGNAFDSLNIVSHNSEGTLERIYIPNNGEPCSAVFIIEDEQILFKRIVEK